MKQKLFIYKLVVLFLVFQLIGCNDNWDKHYGNDGGMLGVKNIGILTALSEMDNVSEFYDAVMAANLDTIFNPNFIYTVFAPENEYFDLESIPEDQRTDYLRMHFTHGEYTADRLSKERLEMFSMKSLNYLKEDRVIVIDNYANVITPDFRVQNGVIHLIDATLIYKKNVYEYMYDGFPFLADHFDSKIIQVMDRENSKPTGEFTPDGKTIYDTVWIDVNTFLIDVADLTDEQAQYTLIIPTEEVIDEAMENDVSGYFGGVENVPTLLYQSILDGIIENSVFLNAYTFDELPDVLLSVGYQPVAIDKDAIFKKDVELSNGILHLTSKFDLDNSSFLKTITVMFKDYPNQDRADGNLEFYIENFNGIEGDNRYWDVSDHSEEALAPNVLLANQNGILSWKEYFHVDDWIEFEIPDVLITEYEIWFRSKGTFYKPKYRVQFRNDDGTWVDTSFDIKSKDYKKGKVMGTISFETFGDKTIRFTSIPGGQGRKTTTSLYELRLIPVTN